MSAFIVGKEHINAILTAGMSAYGDSIYWYHGEKSHTLSLDNADEVGQMLLDENVKSVSARYPDDKITDLPGKCDAEWLIPFHFRIMEYCPSPLQALKYIGCLEYQSCEHDGWATSEAKTFCDYAKDYFIRRLPGYDDLESECVRPFASRDSKPIRLT